MAGSIGIYDPTKSYSIGSESTLSNSMPSLAPAPSLPSTYSPVMASAQQQAQLPTDNASKGAMTGNPYVAGAGVAIDLLSAGYNIYNNERSRRAQVRAIKREIARQEAIRQADLAEQNKWKQIEFAMNQEDRQFSKEEYNKVKRIEYFQRLMDNIMKTANGDAQLKQLLMDRLT